MSEELRPKIGMGIMVMKDGKVLLHRRKGKLGNGEYEFPGGHLEYGESFEDCAKRETMEEAGIKIKNIRFLYIRNFVREYAPSHYVQISMMADWESGEPKNLEPEKGGDWNWFSLDNLPSPLFKTAPFAIEAHKTGKYYFV